MRFITKVSQKKYLERLLIRYDTCMQGEHNSSAPAPISAPSQPAQQTAQPPLFTPVVQSAVPNTWQQKDSASVSWADRCLHAKLSNSQKQYQHGLHSAQEDDVKSAPDRFPIPLQAFPQSASQPGGLAVASLPPAPTSAIHINSMPVGGSSSSHHNRAPSGIELKDAYGDNDLDDDWWGQDRSGIVNS